MALVVKDRVKETSTTTGTGTLTLAGAADGFQSFAAVGDGNTTYYAIVSGNDYEVGLGTYTASGTTLSRTTILESSNSGSALNLGAGTKLSNLRNDGTEVHVRIDGKRIGSGLRKFGAVLGEGCALGCNSVTNPGVVLGCNNVVWPNVTVTGIHGPDVEHR